MSFDGADPGTPESDWLLDPRWDDVPVVSPADALADRDAVVVLAAHPDDECLGAGGLAAAAAGAGVTVHVVLASEGEGSHPSATAWTREQLAGLRRAETERAVAGLTGGRGTLTHLGLPDGDLADHEDAVVEALVGLVDAGTLLLAPWRLDGHPDHDAMGRAARACAARTGARVWWYPIWLWHWGTGADLPWSSLCQVPLDAPRLAAKAAAIAAHASQVTPLGPARGDRPVITASTRARFERLVECYVVDDPSGLPATGAASGRAEVFDGLASADPWLADSWYERRKRSVVMAVLQREEYERVLDIGCSTGELTRELAQRSDGVTAVDVSGQTLARAREGAPAAPITWVVGEVPEVLHGDAVTDAPFDLVVLSEVGYFLTGDELLATLRAARSMLADDGEIVLCHWRHPTTGIPLDGELVHTQARAMLDLPLRVDHRDDDVLVAVYGGTPPTPGAGRPTGRA